MFRQMLVVVPLFHAGLLEPNLEGRVNIVFCEV